MKIILLVVYLYYISSNSRSYIYSADFFDILSKKGGSIIYSSRSQHDARNIDQTDIFRTSSARYIVRTNSYDMTIFL